MLFHSYVFVLAFSPITLLVCSCIYVNKKKDLLKVILFIASVLFYLYSGLSGLGIFALLGAVNFGIYRLMRLTDKKVNVRKGIVCFGISVNLAVLFYFKYYNFFVDNLNFLFKTRFPINEVMMPLGISFLTFQNIAFLVDGYRREIESCTVIDYMFYAAYFPKVSSGPITRFGDLMYIPMNQSKEVFWDNIASGFFIFVMGLGKKVLIADMLLKVTEAGYNCVSDLNTPTALLVSLAYTFQIYFDFSGYSDMAIGMSRMFQIKLLDNFNSPYKAQNIEEFWDRWHISLTRFFTKYLYIPLGGSRRGERKTYMNILIVFLCSGLWHGASWTFIIWGGMHGMAMIINRRFRHYFEKVSKFVGCACTFLFVNFAWIVFRSGDFHTLKGMCHAILKGGWGAITPEVSSALKFESVEKLLGIDIPDIIYMAVFLSIVGIAVFWGKNAKEKAEEKKFTVWNAILTLAIFMVCLLSFSHVSTYIYMRF